MSLQLFHFSDPEWFWGLTIIPLIIALYERLKRHPFQDPRLASFADKHLLPHLIKSNASEHNTWRRSLLLWSLAWLLGMTAMAGPQWRYKNVDVFKPSMDVVVVLDLSQTMNAEDIKPSRLTRAREEISDLLTLNHGLTVGLVAYAAVPHMVVPLTDDMHTLHNLLPSIDTSLITIDGDQLKPALAMAAQMLGQEPGAKKSILVISDGNFAENNIGDLVATAKGAQIDTIGVGTPAGAPAPRTGGGWVKDANGTILISHLHADKLQALSSESGGIYVQGDYNDASMRRLLDRMAESASGVQRSGGSVRTWDEGFYVPGILLGLLLLPWFRKNSAFPAIALVALAALSPATANAASVSDWFENSSQQAQSDFLKGQYDSAVEKFDDPYQKGVAAYRLGNYPLAESLFKSAAGNDKEPTEAEYNLGNAELMQNKPDEAIKSYQIVLKQRPGDVSAKHNLEIAEKMLQQKKQQEEKNSKGSDNPQKPGQEQDPASKENTSQKQSGDTKQSSNQAPAPHPDQKDQGQKQNQGQNSGQGEQGRAPLDQDAGQSAQKAPPSSPPQEQPRPLSPPSARPETTKLNSGADNKNEGSLADKKSPITSSSTDDTEVSSGQPISQASTSKEHSPRDIDADQWLNHIQSEPKSFLKNQFMIEEQKSGAKQEDQQ